MSASTKGQIVNQPPSSGKPAAAANPELTELDALQMLLDLAGMIPGAGAVPDLLNATISVAKGDYIEAALSVVSAVPGLGDAAGAAKIAKNAEKYAQALVVVETKVLPKLPESVGKPLKAFIDKAKNKIDEIRGPKKDVPEPNKPKADTPKKESEPVKGGKDTQIKERKAEKAEPQCFGGKQAKKNSTEYERQLQQQEDALNNMSVSEYLKNRERWGQMKRMGTAAEQAKARADAIADMAKANRDELLAQGKSIKEASTLGKQKAEVAAKGMDVLHSPDLSAGGSAQGTTGLGDKGVNRSIGSNWGQDQDETKTGKRVRKLDESAKEVPEAERDQTKMNVKLKRCP
jgi:Novel toxin 15